MTWNAARDPRRFPPAINCGLGFQAGFLAKPRQHPVRFQFQKIIMIQILGMFERTVEQAHIIGAFRFELSKLTVPAIRLRMISSLLNVSVELATAVAAGLGLDLPAPMPKATDKKVKPEVTQSPSLSLTALPGSGGIETRKVAILITDGVDSASVDELQKSLTAAGAVTRFIGARLGSVKAGNGTRIEADATLENSTAVLFDGMVLPVGSESLARSWQAVEFLKDQFRHCKSILVMGAATALLDKAGIAYDEPDAGLIIAGSKPHPSKALIAALQQHRHPSRDQDPPLV